MGTDAGRLRMVTPLPPLQSGIAQYSIDLLRAAAGRWSIDVVPEPGSAALSVADLDGFRAVAPTAAAPSVVHVGNSDFHRHAFEAIAHPGHLIVLHDTALHSGRLVGFVKRHATGEYRELMRRLYGGEGAQAAEVILAGQPGGLMLEYPLIEDLVGRAAGVIVHSEWAAARVRERAPQATVMVVPMGVPMPHLIEQQAARTHVGLPSDAYVIASITHINPYKRIDTVLRALQRLVRRVPEAVLVIAGSVAPGIDVLADAEMYGVARHVQLLGYVSDDDARIVARAADVCVNLRYPSAGETSASLLRMLGAGRPVIVTDDGPALEIDPACVVRIPVDALEDEYLSEVLALMAQSADIRNAAGEAARQYVRRRHGMDVALNAYRSAIQAILNFDPGEVGQFDVDELAPVLRDAATPHAVGGDWHAGPVADATVNATAALGLGDHTPTLRTVVRRWRELGLS